MPLFDPEILERMKQQMRDDIRTPTLPISYGLSSILAMKAELEQLNNMLDLFERSVRMQLTFFAILEEQKQDQFREVEETIFPSDEVRYAMKQGLMNRRDSLRKTFSEMKIDPEG